MKKQLLSIIAVGAMSGSLFAQLPVSQTPANKKVILEEFTGIYCQYCPDGHKIANNLKASKAPGEVMLVNIHTGSYANQTGNDPDFKTTAGTAIAGMPSMGIAGYPTGAINRHIWTGTAFAMSRSVWGTHANTALSQTSPVNVALQGTVDVNTRVLTVDVEVYYTGNGTGTTNSLTVMMLENNVIGPQTGGATWYPAMMNQDGTYNHHHMLRRVLTAGNFGQPLTPVTTGSSFSITLTYTVPTTFGAGAAVNPCNLGNLEIIAFVADDYKEIRSGAYGPIAFSGITNSLDLAPNNLKTDAQVCDAKLNSSFKFTNNGSAAVTNAVFAYAVNGGAATNYTFTGNVTALQNSPLITLPVLSFAPVAQNTLAINVLQVNGATDQNSVNDLVAKTNIPLTTTFANNSNMTMEFTQDRYGSEVNWYVIDEVSTSTVANGGPYSDLGANGTQLHTQQFNINPNSCYIVKVSDAYGDGVNAGFGVGGYVLKSNTAAIITSNGQYGSGESKWYKSAVNLGVAANAVHVANVGIFPNPTANNANLAIELTQNENVNVTVLNNLGQVVYNQNLTLDAGNNNIKLNTENWAGGIYNINITSPKGSVNHKLTVSK